MTTEVGCTIGPNASAYICWDIMAAGPLSACISTIRRGPLDPALANIIRARPKVTLTPIIARLRQRGTPAGRHGAFVPAPLLPRSPPHFRGPLRRCPPRCRPSELLWPQRTFARLSAPTPRSLLLSASGFPLGRLDYREELGPERFQRAEARPHVVQGLPRLVGEAASLLGFQRAPSGRRGPPGPAGASRPREASRRPACPRRGPLGP